MFRCLTIVGCFVYVFQHIQLQIRKTVLVFWIHPCPIPAKALSTWQRCEFNQKLSNVWKDLGLVPIRILLQYIGLIHHPEQWQVRLTWILLVNIQDPGILVVTVLGEHPVCMSTITDVHPSASDFLRRGLLMYGPVFNAGCFPFSRFGRYRISLYLLLWSVYALHADICWQSFETENAAQKKLNTATKKSENKWKLLSARKMIRC